MGEQTNQQRGITEKDKLKPTKGLHILECIEYKYMARMEHW